MSKLYVFILLLFPCVLFAQEDYDDNVRQQYDQISSLYKEIDEVKGFIAKEKEKLYNLKLLWYHTCVGYLSEGNLKLEELDKLINETRIEIDGEDLYNELVRAKNCVGGGEPYTFKNIVPPTKDDSKSNKRTKEKKKKVASKDDSSKKSEKKAPEDKDSEKKDKKDPSPGVKDKSIESDPKKDKPGDEKVIIESPVKNDDPPVEPETPKKSEPVAPVKAPPKKADKGEMEEGMSKKAKNYDGSN